MTTAHTRPSLARKPTQYDVARAAGVSQTTVSLVLNHPDNPSVSEETRQKIAAAVRSLGYVVNSTARMLRTSRTYTLAAIIPMITNPFYPAFISGIQEMAEMHGYDVLIYNTHSRADREARFVELALQGRVDGVIGVFFYTDARELHRLLENNIPVVRLEVGPHGEGDWPLDNLYVDNRAAAYEAVAYLLSLGRRRIAMITGPGGPSHARCDGYLNALSTCSTAAKPLVQEAGSYDEQGGYDGMMKLMAQEQPAAVFAANDLMAIGAMQAIRDAGLRIPQDIAVVGFDDIPAARLITPALTTIHQDQEGMGRRAVEVFIERLEGKAPPHGRSIEMPYELIIREST